MGSVLVTQNINSKNITNFSHNFIENKIYAFMSDNKQNTKELFNFFSNKSIKYHGKIFLNGNNIKKSKVKESICFIGADYEFVGTKSINSILRYMKRSYPKWDKILALSLLEQAKLNPKSRFSRLSKNQKNILISIITFASCADITIFEEPFEYCNAKLRYQLFTEIYQHHIKHKRCLIISTDRLNEITRYIDKMIFLNHGSILETFTPTYVDNNFIVLTGKKEVLISLLKNKTLKGQPIGLEELETIKDDEKEQELSAYLAANYQKDDIRLCQKYEIQTSKIPLDKLFIFLTLIKEKKNQENKELALSK